MAKQITEAIEGKDDKDNLRKYDLKISLEQLNFLLLIFITIK